MQMSRSYKKQLWLTNSGSGYRKFAKAQANRQVRRSNDVPDGKKYRRYYDSWDICDFKTCRLGSEPVWKARMK